ncbi:MAG: gluconokinase [Christensenellales bacterium]|jgi:gluconokinase
MKILILEASTTSAKAMVYDTKRGALAIENVPYPEDVSDVVSHDAEKEYDILMHTGRQAAKGHSIDMIALVGVLHSFMLAGRDFEPLTRILTWANVECAQTTANMRQDKDLTYRQYHNTGCMVNAIYPAYKLIHMNRTDTLIKDARICAPGDYFFYRMTGDWKLTKTISSGSGLLNIHSLFYDTQTLALANIHESQLPELCEYDHTAPLQKQSARLLGVKSGIPVVVANSDASMNQVGAGGLKEGVMTLSVGTSSALRMTFDTPVIPREPSTWCYYAPTKWMSGAATNSATNCVDWFVKDLLSNSMTFDELEARMPKGEASYPTFLPFLFGERCPGWNDERTSSFCGIKGSETVGHLYRALLEGVVFNIYHCYRILTQVGGVPEIVYVSGGILHSEFWTQMLADILQREIQCPDIKQASMTGATAVAMHVAGELDDLSAFQPPPGRRVAPNPNMAEFYGQRFQKYLHFYETVI